MTDDRAMEPIGELQRRGGVARVGALREAGVSEYALRGAKSRGEIRTVRRGWVALPDADADVMGAIAQGVLLSCVTVAERRGLWVPERSPIHVVAPPHAARVAVHSSVVVHWSAPVVPRPPDVIEDGLVNALVLISRCQPFETALIIWESAMNKGLIDSTWLRQFVLPPAARRLLECARPFADSGLETIFIHRLRWMGVRMLPQAWVHGHRVDLLIGDRLVIQIDGATHTGRQRTNDIAHDAQLTLRGYHVLRFSYEQIMERWSEVQSVIMEAVAQGRHLA